MAFQWVFEGVDKFTGPVGGMLASVAQFAFGLNQTEEVIEKFGRALEWVGEKGLHFSEMALDALAFKEATLNSFEVMLGTRKEAQEMFSKAQAFADLTPFKTHDVVASFQGLSAIFKKDEVPIVFQAIADVASFAGTRQEGQQLINTMTSDIQRMYAYGKASQRDMFPIFNAGRIAGLSPEKWFKQLAGVLGTDVPGAMARYHAGQVSANDATVALLRTIKQIEKGELGTAVIKQSQTINGLISTSQSLMENFFTTMSKEVEDIPGVLAFKNFLREVIGYFNVLTPTGQRVAADIEKVFSGLFEAIFGPLSQPGTVAGFMEPILKFVEGVDWKGIFGGVVNTLLTVGKVVWGFFDGLFYILGPVLTSLGHILGMASGAGDWTDILVTVATVLGELVGLVAFLLSPIMQLIMLVDFAAQVLDSLFSTLQDWQDEVVSFFLDAGVNIVRGLIDGLESAFPDAMATLEGFARDVMGSFAGVLGIQSPSTVFEGFGENTLEGYMQGLEGGMSSVEGAFDGLLDRGPGAAAAGGGSRSVTLTFEEGAFQFHDVGGMDAEDFARRLEDVLASKLAPALENMAMQAGG